MASQSPPASMLMGLPTELQLEIFRHLRSVDLAALCLTSKNVNLIAQPILFRNIILVRGARNGPPGYPTQRPRLDLLVRSLLTRPHLAAYTRRLALVGSSCIWHILTLQDVPKDAVPFDEARAFIRGIGLPSQYTEMWINILDFNHEDALVTLLLALLPNLTALHVGPFFTIHNMSLAGLLHYGLASKQPILQLCPRLRHVTYLPPPSDEEDTNVIRSAARANRFLYARGIEHLTIAIGNGDPSQWPGSTTPNPVNLTSLKLYLLCGARLGWAFRSLQRLTTLDLVYHERYDIDSETDEEVDLDSIAKDLAVVRHTLTSLSISSTEPQMWGQDEGMFEHYCLRSLGKWTLFENIREFRICWELYTGTQPWTVRELFKDVPRNVETLALTSAVYEPPGNPLLREEYFDEQATIGKAIINSVASLDRSLLPRLHTVKVCFAVPHADSSELVDSLKSVTENTGVTTIWNCQESPAFRVEREFV